MSTRRRFLAGAAATTASLLATPALAQNLVEWRMITAWPKGLPGAGTGAQRLADRIGVLTQGQLTIKLYAAGELLPADQNMTAVMAGDAEMSHDMSAYYLSKSPAFAFFSAIPFGLMAQEYDAWIYAKGGRGLWDELGDRFGVRAFPAGNTGARLGGWFRKEINTVDDLKGLRFRIGGLAGQALAKLGVNQVLMPGSQILPKLQSEELDAVNNPEDPSAGTRKVPFSKVIYIEQEDFREDPPKEFFRLAPGREVRLRYAYFIKCTGVIKNEQGEITEVHCTYDPATYGGNAPDGRKVKATIHWVSAAQAISGEVRLYENLFVKEDPNQVVEGQDFTANLNPKSLEILTGCKLEPSLSGASPGERYQFERLGYFCVDPDSTPGNPVFNRTVTLKDTLAKIEKRGKQPK